MSSTARAPLTPLSNNIPAAVTQTSASKAALADAGSNFKYFAAAEVPAVPPADDAIMSDDESEHQVEMYEDEYMGEAPLSPHTSVAAYLAAHGTGRHVPVRDVNGVAIWSPADSLVSPASQLIWAKKGRAAKKAVPVQPTVLSFDKTA